MPADHPDKAREGGSQATPGEFIDWLLDVAEACDRVLAPHGSLCIELGDTYSGSGGGGGDYLEGGWREGQAQFAGSDASMKESNAAHWRQKNVKVGGSEGTQRPTSGPLRGGNRDRGGMGDVIKGTGWPLAKSLSLIPESFRFAMVYGFNPHTGRQTAPWRLRNVIRWVRPNPPVGALGDKFRPATSELMVFCKSAKRYFDLDSVRGEVSANSHGGGTWTTQGGDLASVGVLPKTLANPAGAPPLDWWNIPLLEGEEETRYGKQPPKPSGGPTGFPDRDRVGDNRVMRPNTLSHPIGAPPLDWWEIPPGGYEGAHYAVFPPELCVKPVKAMCPEKVCRQCGEPSRRISENSYTLRGEPFESPKSWDGERLTQNAIGVRKGDIKTHVETLGFSDCGHDDWRPGIVLDCFGGSGTTALVATGHGRDCILIDLDERNFDLALERVGPFILTRSDDD